MTGQTKIVKAQSSKTRDMRLLLRDEEEEEVKRRLW